MAEKTPKRSGTEKKAIYQAAREYRKQGPTRAKGAKKTASFMHGGNRNIAIEKELKGTLGGLEKYRHSEPYKNLKEFTPGGEAYKNSEDFKGLKPFEYKGKSYQKPDFYKEGLQGYEMAKTVLDPIQKQALANFGLNTIPGIAAQHEGGRSSALSQALAAARTNLERDLAAQTSALSAQYGSDISRMNLGERARQQELQQQTALERARMNVAQQASQQGMQYQATKDIFGGKMATNLGLDEQRRANLEYLNNLAYDASIKSQLAGTQNAGYGGQPSGYSSGSPGSPSFGQRFGSSLMGGIQGGATGFLGSGGNPFAAAGGSIIGGISSFLRP